MSYVLITLDNSRYPFLSGLLDLAWSSIVSDVKNIWFVKETKTFSIAYRGALLLES